MASNAVKLKWDNNINDYVFDDDDQIRESTYLKLDDQRIDIEFTSGSNKIVVQDEMFKSFDIFFENMEMDLHSQNLRQKDMNNFYIFAEQLLRNTQNLFLNIAGSNCEKKMERIIKTGIDYISEKLNARNSMEKRRLLLRKRNNFVKPIEKPINLKWKSTLKSNESIVTHKLIQTTFHLIPIKNTLQSLFLNKDFSNMYFDYNECSKHECKRDIVQDFCCTDTYTKLDIFQDSATVQIQLGIDEFEVCDSLKSKAGEQKLCGIYGEIRNVPAFCRTKSNNILLIGIVKMPDVKEGHVSFNEILRPVIDELKLLESEGFQIESGRSLKVALVNVCMDNLGANYVFGFAECFVAEYYCRICEMQKKDCKQICISDEKKIRNMSSYNQNLSKIDVNKVNLRLTKGVKGPCILNELKYFNIFQNYTIDLMHDIFEGVSPFYLKQIFQYIIRQKILSAQVLQSKIRDYNYGVLNKCYKPKNIVIERSHLAQNAKQILCLTLHLPFILFEFKDKIEKFWSPLMDLLKIIQIVMSTSISKSDLIELRKYIRDHLSFIVEELKLTLLPKHHFLTHYPDIIPKVGPPIHIWMMRMDSKHKTFTDMVKRTCNFKNLTKTLAWNHQERLCMTINTFVSNIIASKRLYKINHCSNFFKYEQILNGISDSEIFLGHRFVIINSIQYRAGLLVYYSNKLYEIDHIFHTHNNYVLLCHPYRIIKYETLLNGIEIEKENSPDNCLNIDIDKLNLNQTFQKIISNDKFYVVASTLTVQNFVR